MEQPLRSFKSISFALALLILLPIAGNAQKTKKDNFGKEFYIAFAQNQGGQFGQNEDSNFFALYITSKVHTAGIVEIAALGFSKEFTTSPDVIITIELPDGKHIGDSTVEISTDEQIVSGMAVHVTSDDDVAVYGLNSKWYSGDAFLALPVEVLGTEYLTMNYRSSSRGDTPGEFWIVAPSDSTHVTFYPKSATANGAKQGLPSKIVLNKGDVFLVQGVAADAANDLTGTRIETDLPIAVFSGHVRAEIPSGYISIDTHTSSRNHLVEQLPPVNTWGNAVIVVPYKDALLPDLVRVLSSADNNVITVNGIVADTLKAGDFYEITSLSGITFIQGTSPILVGQFLHTDIYSTNPPPGKISRGDPAYSIVYPVEEYDTAYTFMEAARNSYSKNLINIVADESAIAGMILDSIPIPTASFQAIPGTNYASSQIEIPIQAAHTIHCPKPFGLTVYALGIGDAYAYPAGAILEPINFGVSSRTKSLSGASLLSFTSSPNPFVGQSSLEFILNRMSYVTLAIYDELGRSVRKYPSSSLEAGIHDIQIDGSSLPGGTLYARIAAGFGEVKTVKLVHEK